MNMISTEEVKKILQLKKTELNQEKQLMGLIVKQDYRNDAENKTVPNKNSDLDDVSKPQVPTTHQKTEIRRNNGSRSGLEDQELPRTSPTPPEVAKYMRRHEGLIPAMLKTGEYSPNNPLLLRQPDTSGNVFLGFGEYEEQKKKLRKLRQQEYRDYLDKQSKQRQQRNALLRAEAKKADMAEQNYRPVRYSDSAIEIQNIYDKQNASHNSYDGLNHNVSSKNDATQASYVFDNFDRRSFGNQSNVQNSNRTVESATQCDDLGYHGQRKPSSVAVQTDQTELDKLSDNIELRRSSEMQAERELSPRTVMEKHTLIVPRNSKNNNQGETNNNNGLPNTEQYFNTNEARSGRTIQDVEYSDPPHAKDECYQVRNSPRGKLLQDLRHSYMPSILDAEVIQRRNLKAEQEAASKRQSYQEELRNQILEQQRIKEERKVREKLLEQAEMRRLEQQLRTLQLAQDSEKEKQNKITADIRQNNKQYLRDSNHLQNEIVTESKNLLRAKSHTATRTQGGAATAKTWRSDRDKPKPSNLPLYYAYEPTTRVDERKITTNERTKLPLSMNIPDDSLFSPKYESSYLSMNTVPYKSDANHGTDRRLRGNAPDQHNRRDLVSYENRLSGNVNENTDSALKSVNKSDVTANGSSVSQYNPCLPNTDMSESIARRKSDIDVDSLPIPVLRYSSNNLKQKCREIDADIVLGEKVNDGRDSSDAMKKVESKWQIPIVQRNIVRSVPDVEGRSANGSILTQLGSIRRQLQMEQLKLDKMLARDD